MAASAPAPALCESLPSWDVSGLPHLSSHHRTVSLKSIMCSSMLKPCETGKTNVRLSTSFQCFRVSGFPLTCSLGILTLRDKTVSYPSSKFQASTEPLGLTEDIEISKLERVSETENGCDLFAEIKSRFLSFKRHKYLDNLDYFENLAKGQSPKFMVIACADSRVCPSNILGFQPGEAFIIRNIANLVPPFENGPSETNAALEFAVNSLHVENILIIGHSCCGGIRALMSMQDEDNLSFIGRWVLVGKNARSSIQSTASKLSFDQQCRHCEKESVNHSLLNLFTYPWIKEKARKGVLSVHGGYYDFTDCTFEKWTVDYKESSFEVANGLVFKDRSVWG